LASDAARDAARVSLQGRGAWSMAVLTVRGVARRRWYLAAVGVVVTAAAALAAWSATPTTYTALGSVILMPSPQQASKTGNPFLSIAFLDSLSGVVMVRMDAPEEHARVADAAPTASYDVGPDLTTRGPTVLVTVTDRTATGAMRVLDLVMDRIPAILEDVQVDAGVETDAIVGWMPLARDEEPTASRTAGVTAAAVAGGAGLAGTAALMVAVDLVARRRRRRTQDATDAPSGPGEPDPVEVGAPSPAR
jgi:hypothetical protein